MLYPWPQSERTERQTLRSLHTPFASSTTINLFIHALRGVLMPSSSTLRYCVFESQLTSLSAFFTAHFSFINLLCHSFITYLHCGFDLSWLHISYDEISSLQYSSFFHSFSVISRFRCRKSALVPTLHRVRPNVQLCCRFAVSSILGSFYCLSFMVRSFKN